MFSWYKCTEGGRVTSVTSLVTSRKSFDVTLFLNGPVLLKDLQYEKGKGDGCDT